MSIMPTGSGKTLCFQLPAVLEKGFVVVVSPINSLMEEQVDTLANKLDLPALCYTSGISSKLREAILAEVENDYIKFLYVSPEALTDSEDPLRQTLLKAHSQTRISRLIIDEAHCVEQWGTDEFRPAFSQLGTLREIFPELKYLAVTATATIATQIDILKILQMDGAEVIRADSPFRKCLHLSVVEKMEVDGSSNTQVLEYVRERNGEHGIIYAVYKRDAEEIADFLIKNDVQANFYHGECTEEHRRSAQLAWNSNHIQVMVATSAFGMGIDRGETKWVLHITMPISPEAYWQEAGRAGRQSDATEAPVTMLYSPHEFSSIQKKLPALVNTVKGAKRLDWMKKFCDSSTTCRHKQIMVYFGDTEAASQMQFPCNSCDICKRQRLPRATNRRTI